ncbi:hypothetical protein M3194_20300 [Paenibacillus glycanilyticus]|uniref:hypothetical protein n=1 Tax=Paenibacillus glycanilyticus TaxID=126569 RepID=UPI002041EF8F|nr:hypothetical protein [Paenibacillus glycanilyticus]MCM3629685.1 hypothetical protein [Paenibacillus glycanilyticus]
MVGIKKVIGLMAVMFVLASTSAHAAPQTIPMLQSAAQLSPNQLQITYDRTVDEAKGVNPTNYWVQSTTEAMPSGIATLGKNDTVGPQNALTSSKVTIRPVDAQNKSFILTFMQPITKGMSYKLIICYVTVPGDPPYSGDNGSAVFVGQ